MSANSRQDRLGKILQNVYWQGVGDGAKATVGTVKVPRLDKAVSEIEKLMDREVGEAVRGKEDDMWEMIGEEYQEKP